MAGVDFAPQPVNYHQVTPADPGANTNYTYTVPDNTAVELIALYIDVVAAAVVHAADFYVQIDYHTTQSLCQVLHSWAPLGGTTTRFSCALNLTSDALSIVTKASRVNLPDRLYLYPTNTITLSMHNDEIGDAFTNISLYLRSWIME